MKKVITANDVAAARKAGGSGITVPVGALITPQAMDDARQYGITLRQEGTEAAKTVPRPAGFPIADGDTPRIAAPTTRPAGFPIADGDTLRIAAPAPFPAGRPASMEAEIRRRVLERLGTSVDPSLVDAVITAALAEAGGVMTAPVEGMPAGVDIARPASLSKEGFTAPAGSLVMLETLAPTADMPGTGYMEWENASFEHCFSAAEVLTVIEGELRVSNAGGTACVRPGETLRVRPGFSLLFAASGRVRLALSSWEASARTTR